jgi:hypothetical protein
LTTAHDTPSRASQAPGPERASPRTDERLGLTKTTPSERRQMVRGLIGLLVVVAIVLFLLKVAVVGGLVGAIALILLILLVLGRI